MDRRRRRGCPAGPGGRPILSRGPAWRQALTLALRVLTEAGIVGAFAWWGYQTGAGTGMKILLAVGAPALGFGFWGAVDFRQAGRLAEPLRLLQELAISALAAAALYAAGQHLLGWALGLVSVVYHALVYLLGGRLLQHP
jgi:Protein of unknown function (DUF2568)